MKKNMRPVVGFESLYSVTEDGDVYGVKRGKFRKLMNDKNGYLVVSLCKKNIIITKKAHRIVAEAFIPNPLGRLEVNHRNGIKSDNRVENLEWCTFEENTAHACLLGLKPAKGNHYMAKVTLDLSTGIFYDSLTEAVDAKNMNYSTVNSAMQKGNFKHGLIFIQ